MIKFEKCRQYVLLYVDRFLILVPEFLNVTRLFLNVLFLGSFLVIFDWRRPWHPSNAKKKMVEKNCQIKRVCETKVYFLLTVTLIRPSPPPIEIFFVGRIW